MLNYIIFCVGLILCMAYICTDDGGNCSLSYKVDGRSYC